MVFCPYQLSACRRYLSQVSEISSELADRIRREYCESDFRTCGRYIAGEEGTLEDQPDLAPWSCHAT